MVAGERPAAVRTWTLARPAGRAGAVTRSWVLDSTVKPAVVPPKVTCVVPVKLVPPTTRTVPPRTGPADTDRLVTVGVLTTGGAM